MTASTQIAEAVYSDQGIEFMLIVPLGVAKGGDKRAYTVKDRDGNLETVNDRDYFYHGGKTPVSETEFLVLKKFSAGYSENWNFEQHAQAVVVDLKQGNIALNIGDPNSVNVGHSLEASFSGGHVDKIRMIGSEGCQTILEKSALDLLTLPQDIKASIKSLFDLVENCFR